MDAEFLIDMIINGDSVEETIEEVMSEEIKRTATRPRKRRFSGRTGVNPVTGKRKDPKRRLAARKAARKGKAKRKAAIRKFHRSAKGKRFHKKLGRLSARIRR